MAPIFKDFRRLAHSFINHPYTLGSILLCSYLLFVFHPGALLDIMRLSLLIYLLILLTDNNPLNHVTSCNLVLFIIVAVLVGSNWFVAPDRFHKKSVDLLIAFPGTVWLTHAFANRIKKEDVELFTCICFASISVCIIFQLLRVYVIGDLNPSGFYRNTHHLGLFAGLMFPILIWFMFIFSGWKRTLVFPVLTANFFLLDVTGSKVSYLAIFIAALLTLLSFLKKTHFIVALILLISLISGFALFRSSLINNNQINNLTINLKSDKRWVIWTDTVDMLKANGPIEWSVGHGIGSFRYYFPEFDGKSSRRIRNNVNFPHNMFLQIVFENGLLSLFLITGGFVFIPLALRSTYNRTRITLHRHLVLLMFYGFICVVVQCLFTKSVYSKYFLYSLSVILGMSFFLFESVGLDVSVYDLLQRCGAHFKYLFFRKR